jgi:16S rRNA (guanine1516-N2)-methyltransferase
LRSRSIDSAAPGATGVRGFSFALRDQCDRLTLFALHRPRYGGIAADWLSPEVQRRIRGGRRQLLARAAGLHKQACLRVLDATAGLGQDGFVLAALGAEVTLAERHPLIVQLLHDARRRAMNTPAATMTARVHIVEADAATLMTPDRWDVVMLDPMYPDRRKTALSGKAMQLLRELTGGDADADALLPPALRCARRRVVVKRPLKAPPLGAQLPSLQLRGTQARFDVYLLKAEG